MSHVIRGGKCAVTSTLEEMMEKNEIIGRWAPFMQEFGFDEGTNTIYIKDNRTNRIAVSGVGLCAAPRLRCAVGVGWR